MKILHLIHRLNGGGAERQLCYLAPALVKLGHEVHIIYHQRALGSLDLPGVVLHKIDASSNVDPFLFWQTYRITKEIQPDLINTWIMQMDIIGGIISCWLGIPWVLREPSSKDAYPPTIKFGTRAFLASYAAKIISNSENGNNYWKPIVQEKRLCVVRNGVPLKAIASISGNNEKCVEGLVMPFFLSVGRLTCDATGNKNLKSLLSAVISLQNYTEFGLAICGDGPQSGELLEICENHSLGRRVQFLGEREADIIWQLMKSSEAYISLSAFEGCPNTVLEAMACECPLIVSDIPAHREILDENSALFVDPANIQQVSDAIMNILSNPVNARLRAKSAFEKVQKWDVEEMAKNYEKAYFSIL